MAEVNGVRVNGAPFAVCSTLANADMLARKINKVFEGNPAAIDMDGILYNPKHVDALARLDGMGLTRFPTEETTEPEPTRRKAAPRKR